MKILVTGAKGFVGKNLVTSLYNLQENKDRTRPKLQVEEIYEYDIDTAPELLETYCENADFVFNLAGVNRPKEQSEFMEGNFGFASTLLDTLKNTGIHVRLCFLPPFRPPCWADMLEVNMGNPSWQERNCF